MLPGTSGCRFDQHLHSGLVWGSVAGLFLCRLQAAPTCLAGGRNLASSHPPSTGKITPVMKLAASEARNAQASPTSSGFPGRPKGHPSIIICLNTGFVLIISCVSGVTIRPGAMALTRMPDRPNSVASWRVSPIRAALVALYPALAVTPAMPQTDAMFMIEPPRSRM